MYFPPNSKLENYTHSQSQDSGMGNYVNGHLNGHHQNGHNGHVQHHHQDGQNGVGSRRPGIGHLGLHGRSRSSCSSPNNVLEDMTWTCLRYELGFLHIN